MMPTFRMPCSSSLMTMPDAARHPRQRVELRIEVREEAVRLEPALGLGEHHVERLLLDQPHRVHLGIERRAMASACASVFPTSAKLVGSAMLCASAMR